MPADTDDLPGDLLDEGVRGVPPGTEPLHLKDVAARGWCPADGSMSLPVLTLDEAAFAANRDAMFAYLRSHGLAIAPHAKTPMAPRLAADLVAAGAWGATVADTRQAAVLLRAGINRLLLANQIGGRASGVRLGRLLAAHPEADIRAFADSPASVAPLAIAAETAGRPLSVLVEVGAGRAGARDLAGIEATIAAIEASSDRLVLDGVAAYEGAAAVPGDPAATVRAITALMKLAAEAFARVRAVTRDRHLLLTAGGSSFFDLVVGALTPVVATDGQSTLLLRSGAIFFHDHGTYERALVAMDARSGFVVDGAVRSAAATFRPALLLWAEVLSLPEPGLAICGFGRRDASFDQDLPRPLRVYRNGRIVQDARKAGLQVTQLNDQHAFMSVPEGTALTVGDIVAFGISHPCTCLDHWQVLFGLDDAGRVTAAYRTFFG